MGVIFGEHKGPVCISDQGSFSLEFGVRVGKLHCTCGGCCLFVCCNKLTSLQKSMQEKKGLRLCLDLGFGVFSFGSSLFCSFSFLGVCILLNAWFHFIF